MTEVRRGRNYKRMEHPGQLFGRAQVIMSTRGQNNAYSHPVSTFDSADLVFTMGWCDMWSSFGYNLEHL